jgi:hypothetical protein
MFPKIPVYQVAGVAEEPEPAGRINKKQDHPYTVPDSRTCFISTAIRFTSSRRLSWLGIPLAVGILPGYPVTQAGRLRRSSTAAEETEVSSAL